MTNFDQPGMQFHWGDFRPPVYRDESLPHQLLLKRRWRERYHTMHTHLSCNCGWDGGFCVEGVDATEDIALYRKHVENPDFIPDRVYEEQEAQDLYNPLVAFRG